jgi:hypothetical protein
VAAVLVVWRVGRPRIVPKRVVTLITIALAFWILTALNRAQISPPFASRYLYVGALILVLLAAELGRGVALRSRAKLLLVGAVAAAIVSNVGAFRDGARYLRDQADLAKADLGALDAARPLIKRDLVAQSFPGYPFVLVSARSYFATEHEFGSPAATPRELANQPEPARATADAQLVAVHRPTVRPAPRGLRLGRRPVVDSAAGGVVAGRGPCLRFRPARFTATGARSELELTLPQARLLLRARGGPATISLRRFSSAFPRQPLGRLAPSVTAVLRVARDRGVLPWHVRVVPTAGATVCGLR